MKQIDEDLIRSFAASEERQISGHPSPDELVAYHRNQLGAEADDALQEHLTWCRECSALLLDLEDMTSEAVTAQGADWTEAWPEASRRLRQAGVDEPRPQTPVPAPAPAAVPPPGPVRSSPLPLALAATLVAAVGGLLLWNLQLRTALRHAEAPQVNVAVHDLSVDDRVRSDGEGTMVVVEMGAGEDHALLILTPQEPPEKPSYGLRILDQHGERLWEQTGLRPTSFGNFTVLLARSDFPPGRYVIEVFDAAAATGRSIYSFDFRFSDPPPRPTR